MCLLCVCVRACVRACVRVCVCGGGACVCVSSGQHYISFVSKGICSKRERFACYDTVIAVQGTQLV